MKCLFLFPSGRPAPSVSCCSDSDDDVISRPSEEELRAGGGGGVPRPSYLPTGEPRYVRTLPSGPASGGSRQQGGHSRPRSADRRRPSPASPAAARPSLRRDVSLRRKDPYYYSDILARDSGDVSSAGDDVSGAYRAPYDERRSSSRGGGPLYSQPDVAAGDLRSPRARDPDHVAPLANRIALDPFVDSYGVERGRSHRQRHKLSSFGGGASAAAPGGQRTPERGYPGTPGGYSVNSDSSRHRPPLQWTH